jgi:hypothetical protein
MSSVGDVGCRRDMGTGLKEAKDDDLGKGGGISFLRGDGKCCCHMRNRNITGADKRSAGNAVFPAGYLFAYVRARRLLRT